MVAALDSARRDSNGLHLIPITGLPQFSSAVCSADRRPHPGIDSAWASRDAADWAVLAVLAASPSTLNKAVSASTKVAWFAVN